MKKYGGKVKDWLDNGYPEEKGWHLVDFVELGFVIIFIALFVLALAVL